MLLRGRVSDAIDTSLEDRGLCVVSAPSGYGKTVAVADWAAEQQSLSWLLLNSLDADASHLNRGIIEALSRGYRRVGCELPGLDEHADPRYLFAALREAINDAGVQMQLVVDDAHRAGEGWRRGLLGMLADEPPDGLRMVVVGTTLLEVTMPRERLLEPSLFVGTEHLRLTEEEIETLSAEAEIRIDPAAVLRETHGWPIAVRMVMIGGSEPVSEATTASTFLGDYVRDHVLAALAPDLAEFVLASTICKEVTPDLAAAVTGAPNAADLLDQCVRLGLFLDRYSTPTGVMYRWHSTFVRTCADIRRSDPEGTAARHRAAAQFLSSAQPLKSVEHSLRADDPAAARETLVSQWVTLLLNGNGREVESAAAALLRLHPRDVDLRFILACATDVLGDHHLASEMMKRAERAAANDQLESTTADIARLFVCDDPERVCGAVTRLRRVITTTRSDAEQDAAINILLGWAELRNPTNPALPAEYFDAAARARHDQSDREAEQRTLGHLAFGLTWAGRLSEAAKIAMRVKSSGWLRVLDDRAYAGASAKAAAGYVAYWAGDSKECHAEFSAILNGGGNDPSFAAIARMMIAYAVAEGADPSASRRAAIGIQEIPIETLHSVPWQVFRESSIAMLEEASGNRERAVRIARKYAQATTLPIVLVALAGILRRAGEHVEALQMLRSLQLFSEVSYVKTSTLITAAIIRRRAGDHALAHELCEAALAIAARENIRLPFSPRETAVRKLLSEHIHFGSQYEDFIGSCLASDVAGSSIDTLSERELDVFRQLQTSRTLPEIATALNLSINTVKTHQRAIYRKLGVASRRDAVHTTV